MAKLVFSEKKSIFVVKSFEAMKQKNKLNHWAVIDSYIIFYL